MTLPSAGTLTHWEDFVPGQTYALDTFALDGAAAGAFDAVFSRPGAAEPGCVSGMYLTGRLMRAITDSYLVRAAGLGAGGIPEIDWVTDARPGLALSAIMTCVEKRALRSRPGVGLNVLTNAVVDKTGRQIISWRANQFMRMRNPEAHAGDAPTPTTKRTEKAPSDAAGAEAPPLALGSHTFDREQIIAFASRFDPQAFHLEDAAAKASLFGALCASGWHTCSVWHRLLHDHLHRETGFEEFGRTTPSVPARRVTGLRNLRWLRPVFVGETISFAINKVHGGSATRGATTLACSGTTSDGTPVFSLDAVVT